MSMTQVLTNLSNARDGIVSALSGRGLTVSSSTTLTDAATVISTLPMSGSVDVSDTTATAGDVLSGAYFYTSDGTKTQGTIPSLASQTITPGTSAQVISGGQYLAGDQTIAGDADLIESNIKSGVTIFGVTGSLDVSSGGVDVSDTTATAGSVLSGTYFYDSTGTKTQGTIPTVTASQSANVVTVPAGYHANSQTVTVGSAVQSQTITPGTSAQVLSSGGYLVGDVTIAGDASLISSNIVSGATIFGVSGSAITSGGVDVSDTTAQAANVQSGYYFYTSGGVRTAGTLAGGSTNFYKCASVDSDSTWSGYLATIQNGMYKYSSTATTGLHYSTGYVPEVGKTYSEDAMIEANLWAIPSNSLVFYAPLSSASNTAETGQTINPTGTVNYTIVAGVPCAESDTTKFINVGEYQADLDPGIPKTISVWVYITAWNETIVGFVCCMQDGGGISIQFDSTFCRAERWKGGGSGGTNYAEVGFGQLSLNTWYHLVCTDDGTTIKTYVNGSLVTEATPGGSYRKAQTSIYACLNGPGGSSEDLMYNLIGYMAAPRIYSRVLSNNEIRALSKEFTPTSN